MVTLQNVQGHTGLTHPLIFGHSGTLALRTERFDRPIFATIRKSVGLNGLALTTSVGELSARQGSFPVPGVHR